MLTLQHNNNWDLTLGDANVIINVMCVNGLGFTSHVNVKHETCKCTILNYFFGCKCKNK